MKRKYFRAKVRQQIADYKQRIKIQNAESICTTEVGEQEDEENCAEEERHLEKLKNIEISLRQKLKNWYIETKPTRYSAERLLCILSEEGLDVPLSVATLVGKKCSLTIRSVPPGSYCHLGIERQFSELHRHLCQVRSVRIFLGFAWL